MRHSRQHWYRIHLGSCPICMADKSYRERVYGRRPKRWRSRVVWMSDRDCYDWCDVL